MTTVCKNSWKIRAIVEETLKHKINYRKKP
jgi:hypothetical protein